MKTFKALSEDLNNWHRGDLLLVDVDGIPQKFYTHIQSRTIGGIKDNLGNYWNEDGTLIKFGADVPFEKYGKDKVKSTIVDKGKILKLYKQKINELLMGNGFNEKDAKTLQQLVDVIKTIFSGDSEHKIFGDM